MPTSKKRVNLTLPEEVEHILELIAKRDNIPVATVALRMLERGIAWEEDEILGHLAEERDTKDATFLSHEEAWKNKDL